MAKFTEATPITLGAPVAGIDLKSPLAGMQPNKSPWLLNVNCENQKISVRPGYVVHSTIGSGSEEIYAIGVWGSNAGGTEKLFAYVNDGSGTHKIYDVSASAESLVETCADDAALVARPFNFAKRLGFVVEQDWAQCSRQYNGTTWDDWGFTYSAAEIGAPVCVSFKGRVYLFSGTNMYYGALLAITGATSLEDLQYVFDDAGSITWAGVLSSPSQRSEEIYLAIGLNTGEILVYGGDYPGSATWGIVGRFRIGPPLGHNSVLSWNNDLLILTRNSIVSLRGLFETGNLAADQDTFSDAIDEYWTKLVTNSNLEIDSTPITGAYWPEQNKLFFLVPGHYSDTGTYTVGDATMFVRNTITGAWSLHKLDHDSITRTGGLTYFNNSLYFFTDNKVVKIDKTVFKDEALNSPATYSIYDWEVQGAHTTFGVDATNKRLVEIKAHFKTDFSNGVVGVRGVADFGLSISDFATVELVDGYNNKMHSVGVDGDYLQYRVAGSSDTGSTDGLELYSVTAIVKAGGRG